MRRGPGRERTSKDVRRPQGAIRASRQHGRSTLLARCQAIPRGFSPLGVDSSMFAARLRLGSPFVVGACLIVTACPGSATKDVATGGPSPGRDADPDGGSETPRAECPQTMPTSVNGALVVYEGFDGPSFVNAKEFSYKSGSAKPTTSIRRKGSGAALFRVGDPQLTPAQCTDGRYRAEVVAKPVQEFGWDDGITHWVGVSANPTNFTGSAYSLIQVHAPNEPDGSACDYAGNAFALTPTLRDGTMYYELDVILEGGRSAGQGASSGQARDVWSEPMIAQKWVDFVMGFTLSTKGKGFFHFFRNGELVYSKTGVTNVNALDSCGAPVPADKRSHNGPHIGIYGPPCGDAAWMQTLSGPHHLREVVMDEFRVATGPDGYLYADPMQCGVLPAGYPKF